jgi:hypothetical protein
MRTRTRDDADEMFVKRYGNRPRTTLGDSSAVAAALGGVIEVVRAQERDGEVQADRTSPSPNADREPLNGLAESIATRI